nr:DUF3800 domain-containing protein [uncultured Sphingomonas sp.]
MSGHNDLMYRLYVDEVGTDDLGHLEADEDRYLSLTGVAMKIDQARDDLKPKMDWIKANVFGHDPDEPVIFHRRKIVQRKQVFGILNDDAKRDRFNRAMLRIYKTCDYNVITVVIDKKAMVRKEKWREKHPYHYLMAIMADKFTRFLERKNSIGDIMPEARMGKKDSQLQSAYEAVRQEGIFYVSGAQICKAIPSKHLKFRPKSDNVAGLQLADLLAHPSHMIVRERQGHAVRLGAFCNQIKPILLAEKYDRSNSGTVLGYGMKWLP